MARAASRLDETVELIRLGDHLAELERQLDESRQLVRNLQDELSRALWKVECYEDVIEKVRKVIAGDG